MIKVKAELFKDYSAINGQSLCICDDSLFTLLLSFIKWRSHIR